MEGCSSCVKLLKCYDSELNSINITEGYSLPNIRTCFSPTSYVQFDILLVLKEHQFVQTESLPLSLKYEFSILCFSSRLNGVSYSATF